MGIKLAFLLLILLVSPYAAADEGYVSPETYAVNEADLTDYYNIPSSPRLNIDDLDKPVKDNKTEHSQNPEKVKKADKKPYEKRLVYKMAKWWKDQSYKREDPHHGEKHEIKVKQRMEYEKQQSEQATQHP